jgi:hypothetical protein
MHRLWHTAYFVTLYIEVHFPAHCHWAGEINNDSHEVTKRLSLLIHRKHTDIYSNSDHISRNHLNLTLGLTLMPGRVYRILTHTDTNYALGPPCKDCQRQLTYLVTTITLARVIRDQPIAVEISDVKEFIEILTCYCQVHPPPTPWLLHARADI